MPVTDADRLVAAGAELTIAGHLFHVRYTPRSLKMIEDRYGSLDASDEAMKTKTVSATYFMLAAGLRHEKVDGEPVTEDWLLDNSLLSDLKAFSDAAGAAFAEAIPGPKESEVPTKPVRKTGRIGSNGQTTSGSPSGTFIEVLQSSGTG